MCTAGSVSLLLPTAYRWLLDSPWARKLGSGVQLRPGYVPVPAELRRRGQEQLRQGEQQPEPSLADLQVLPLGPSQG